MKYWVVKVVWVGPQNSPPFIEIEIRGIKAPNPIAAKECAIEMIDPPAAYLKITSTQEM